MYDEIKLAGLQYRKENKKKVFCEESSYRDRNSRWLIGGSQRVEEENA